MSANGNGAPVPGTLGQRLRDGARDLGARVHQGRRGEPASDEGIKLADIPFGGRRVLRLRIVQSERHPAPALSVRMWERDEGGVAWPLAGVGAGFVVARANLPAFAEAVARALELMWNDGPPPKP
ncbi:MAG TPA: hypothetical protein VFG23_05430 [Polyangia bacterium]|nr:hypothetical protein [Polyangia bacterium]